MFALYCRALPQTKEIRYYAGDDLLGVSYVTAGVTSAYSTYLYYGRRGLPRRLWLPPLAPLQPPLGHHRKPPVRCPARSGCEGDEAEQQHRRGREQRVVDV